ncbi:hypothetical protein [Sphingobacterium yanglingense]|uniref:Uncharacterized protein n=1 Tax=Sphingobacterium yanglingense TaxID=1437280 RepID=A0A4R6WGX6_9SPHI|nr:hypothetical protein [Sphingobacterium yanglingense]TDQ77457.1 hypothetical protein CLV99_2864 [Sphingobacterium yanglingense]
MPTNTITKRYYPALSEVISTEDLPEFLHFAEEGLENILSKIYYKNLQYSRSQRGDSAFYSLDIISKSIGLPLPFGMRLVLNPDTDGDSQISSFPISLQYQWELLAYLRAFKVEGFSFEPDAMFELGLQLFKLTDAEVIAHIINYFIDPELDIDAKFQNLVDSINFLYPSANLTLPVDEEPTAVILANLIRQNTNIPAAVSAVMFAIYILADGLEQTKANLQQFYQLIMPSGIESYIRNLITPKVRATVTLSAGIEFPHNILKPLDAQGNPDLNKKAVFKFVEATFYADTEAGMGSEIELSGSLLPGPCQIGNSGFVIDFQKAKLDLSKKKNIPEADLAGYGPDFTGLYVKRASVAYQGLGIEDTERPSIAIVADDLLIGTGGLSGRIALESEGYLYRKFGNFAVELNRFSVGFNKGQIQQCDIAGTLTLPGFKQGAGPAIIDIEAQVLDNGEFMVAAKPQTEFFTITLPNILNVHISKLQLGKEAKGFYIEVAGRLDFLAEIPGLGQVLPKQIEVQRFRIWDNGDMEFEGGSLVIPKAFRLKIGPVNIEVNQISFGAHSRMLNGVERKYRYFGFDGMVNTGRAGVKANGDGIKYYFTTDHNDTDKPFDHYTSIDAIGVEVTVPGNVSKENAAFYLKGYLSMSNPDPSIIGSNAGVEYTGAVDFALPKIGLVGSAAMRLNPKIPAFIVDIGLELPIPIPLGPTGLGIYGFRGLIGQHYVPAKSATTPPLKEDATWWDYYKAKSKITGREGIEIDKFATKSGFSVGAGISLATSYDKGYTFSSKLFIMLGLPDVFLLQGQAGIIRNRIGLTKDVDPPFSALLAIDSKSVMTSLGVNYRLPEGGSWDGGIISIKGTMELAFFFKNSSAWYINLGRETPDSARIQAKVLSIFQVYAYLMISSKGINMGAGAEFNFNKKFGPVSVGLGAFIHIRSAISFKPMQLGGSINLGGYAYLKVWKFKFGISVAVILAAEAPNPFSIYGALVIGINLPWPFKDIKFKLELGWTFNKDNSALRQPIEILKLPSDAEGYMPVAAKNILSTEIFPVNYVRTQLPDGVTVNIPAPGHSSWKYNFNTPADVENITIPLDSYIDIDLLQAVKPGSASRIGGNANQLPSDYLQLVPTQKGLTDQVSHELQIAGLDIFSWNPTNNRWDPYYIYEAVTAIVDANNGEINLRELKDGYWQFDEPNRYNKIRLLSQNMFTMASELVSVGMELDGMNYNRKDLFCYENIEKQIRIDWTNDSLGLQYPDGSSRFKDGLTFQLKGLSAVVRQGTGSSINNLQIDQNNGTISIVLDQPLGYFGLEFGYNDNIGNIRYYTTREIPLFFGRKRKVEHLVKTSPLQPDPNGQSILYNQQNEPINKIVIELFDRKPLNFLGDLQIGGYYKLLDTPAQMYNHTIETKKSVSDTFLFNRALNGQEIVQGNTAQLPGLIGYWKGPDPIDQTGNNNGIFSNRPFSTDMYWSTSPIDWLEKRKGLSFVAKSDSLVVRNAANLIVENGDFSFGLTVMLGINDRGISTLLTKVFEENSSGYKKGFSLHIDRREEVLLYHDYRASTKLPKYTVLFTAYHGDSVSVNTASCEYTLDCETGFVPMTQYVQITGTLSRATNKLSIYINKEVKLETAIPAELEPSLSRSYRTELNAVTLQDLVTQQLISDNQITREGFITENQLVHTTLNRTIQPIWRPNTIFAVAIKVRDIVNKDTNGARQKNFVYGFRTAGPIGHFHQQSAVYKKLRNEDRADSFKLSNLKHYIDYERSFPDALGRFERSKPVFHADAEIALLFNKSYINAMYSNWATYQGAAAVQSKLTIQLLDPYGEALRPELQWEDMPEQLITDSNYKSLPPDQQALYLLNRAAIQDGCNLSPINISKRKKKGVYKFPMLLPNRLYTAVFESEYQPVGQALQTAEVHRFAVMTSRFATFEEQAANYTVHAIELNLEEQYIMDTVSRLWLDNYEANDTNIMRYAFKFDRVLFGGLKINKIDQFETTVIQPIINIDPTTQNKRIIAVLIHNPEPFNNPNLVEADRTDTLLLGKLNGPDFVKDDTVKAVHNRDTSAVLLSNDQLSILSDSYAFRFRYKKFDGEGYNSLFEEYISASVSITTT